MFDKLCARPARAFALIGVLTLGLLASGAAFASAQEAASAPAPATQETARHAGGEANLVLPDLSTVDFHGINSRTLLMGGLFVCMLGLAFGMVIFVQLKNLPVHRSMRDISELI